MLVLRDNYYSSPLIIDEGEYLERLFANPYRKVVQPGFLREIRGRSYKEFPKDLGKLREEWGGINPISNKERNINFRRKQLNKIDARRESGYYKHHSMFPDLKPLFGPGPR